MKHNKLSSIISYMLVCVSLSWQAAAQTAHPSGRDLYNTCHSGAYTMMDRHFHGILFPEVYKKLPSAKISYPGYWTTDKSYAAAGLLADRVYDRGRGRNADWSAIYGWADIDNDPGAGGAWVGNFNWGNELRSYRVSHDSVYYMDSDYFSLRGAAWITPTRGKTFKGISVTVDIDNAYAYDGDEFNYPLDRKAVYVDLTALLKIGGDYHLRIGARTYNMQSLNQLDGETSLDDSKLYSDGIYVGLIDDERHTLDFRVDNTYRALHSWDKRDTLSFGLRYSQGGALSYMRHMFFFGLAAEAGAAFGAEIGEEVGTFEYGAYLRNLTSDGWALRTALQLPLVLDVSLYGPLRLMLSAAPQASYTRFGYKYPQHDLLLELPRPELSLRGTVGKMFDYALKPTVSNDVFISALEVRYRF